MKTKDNKNIDDYIREEDILHDYEMLSPDEFLEKWGEDER